ncbi:hypothetical protein CspeluHIS016_0200090 [Cutaneotrichosporon spelunceum]|uniref:Uncharacterized protein n=1 Tax=Cutaneotrichosporon spelunceum TaxID=1672016 RepID=A0AAD3YAE1_9TREE|nr:hypothetical protein CspeluHIS016_0200090 [Cutaneotrichosporon spelunceum]
MIDHDGFPAIIATILAYSPESALHAWRATSKQYQQAADAALLHHIILDVPPCRPARALQPPLHVRSASGRRIPGLAWEDADASPAQREAWAAKLRAHVRVVDYAAEIAFPDDDAKLGSALAHTALLRRRFAAHDIIPWRLDCWRYALPALRVVDYVCLDRRVTGAQGEEEEIHRHVVLDMPPSVRSSVTVIRYDAADAAERPYRWQFWDRLGHAPFVCVFVNTGDTGDTVSTVDTVDKVSAVDTGSAVNTVSAVNTPAQPAQRPWTFVRPLIRALRSYAPSTRPVLVGVTEIPRAAIGLEPGASDDEVRASFLELLVAEVLSWDEVGPGRLRRITESITFLTHAEYRERVGADAYELEVGARVFDAPREGDAREVLRQLRM